MGDLKNKENCIEWITGQNTIAVSLTQQKYITKVRKLKKRFPKQVKIHTNEDGSIFAKLPLSALRIVLVEREELSEQEKERRRENLKKAREVQGK